MKQIYLYTTETYRAKNWYKIGQTTGNSLKRIQHQDNASNPEPLIIISNWFVPDQITDKKVHKVLIDFGFEKLRGNREWFELSDTPIEDVESAILTLDSTCKPIVPIFDIDVPYYSELWWFNGTNPTLE